MELSDAVKQFSGRRYINFESYEKNGKPRLTPVQSVEDNGLVFVRTDPRTWKVRRILRNSRVRIVPSDRAGDRLEHGSREKRLSLREKSVNGL